MQRVQQATSASRLADIYVHRYVPYLQRMCARECRRFGLVIFDRSSLLTQMCYKDVLYHNPLLELPCEALDQLT